MSLLSRMGHAATLTENGSAVIDAFKGGAFDVILMDVQMPELGGLEATAVIREIERSRALRRTPIVALTARAMRDDEAECRAAGMDHYISKPIHSDRLADVLEHIGGLHALDPGYPVALHAASPTGPREDASAA